MNGTNPRNDLLKAHQIPSINVDWFIRTNDSAKIQDTSVSSKIIAQDPTNTEIPKKNNTEKYQRRNSIATTTPTLEKNNTKQSDIKTRDIKEAEDSSLYEPNAKETNASSTAPLRKTKSASVYSTANEQTQKKTGFFKSLFSRKKNQPQVSQETSRKIPSPQHSAIKKPIKTNDKPTKIDLNNNNGINTDKLSPPTGLLSRSKTDTEITDTRNKDSDQHHHFQHHHHHGPPENSDGKITNDTLNDECSYSNCNLTEIDSELDVDSKRLLEFLKYYKEKGYSVSAFKDTKGTANDLRRPRTKAYFSIDGTLSKPKVYDAKGRLIPQHPEKSILPSAIKRNCKTYGSSSASSSPCQNKHAQLQSSSSGNSSKNFGAFLRRVTSHSASNNHIAENNIDQSSSTTTINETDDFDPSDFKILPGLEDLKPLKHVSFATNTYFNDPPQQICSKNPRKGEVEVKPNGSVVIHRLTPEEKRKILEETTTGIVVGGSGQLKLLVPENEKSDATDTDAKKQEEKIPLNFLTKSETTDSTAKDDSSNTRRTITLAAAEVAAEARGKAAPNDLRRTVTNNEEEVSVSKSASHLTIDKPMISRRSSTHLMSSSTSLLSDGNSDSDDEQYSPKDIKIPHDVVYTRCCHLREILPIPATLKQLKAGSTDPIPLLQLRNPGPSMVEVWSFSDFISIAPVLCVSLDGVHLTVDMLRIILSSLTSKNNFEKLSLRNTPLDAEGWKVLSYFVSHSKSLISIDLTMVPHIKVNVQKPSKSSLKNQIKRMACSEDDRSDMNWNLLAGAIAVKGGLEELLLSGAKMNLQQFKMFIEVGCSKSSRLGLAYNELTMEQCEVFAKWIFHSNVTGLDIGFNDLRGKLGPFSAAMFDKIHTNSDTNHVRYISLNNTNLEVEEGATSETNEFLKLLSILCFSREMKFLDLSNNPKIFPHCMHTLLDCLPGFVGLGRLHLDFNNLNATEIVTIAEVLPLCSGLRHFSMIGTPLNLASSKALAEAVKKSTSLITLDLDYAYIPEKIRDEISLYSMRNIQSEFTNQDDSLDKNKTYKSITKPFENNSQLQSVRDEFTALLTQTLDDSNKEEYYDMVEKFINKVYSGRKRIRRVIHDLFDLRVQGELNFEGKEALIRLCYIDASLEKSVRLLKQRHESSLQRSDTSMSKDSNIDLSNTNSLDSRLGSKQTVQDIPATILLSSSFNKTGHSVLLPFGSILPERSTHKADEMVEFRDDDTHTRLVGPISSKNKDTNDHLDEIDKDSSNKIPSYSILPAERDAILSAAQTSNSDRIKDLLLKNDASAVLKVIDELHNQGYHLHHIFKKQCPKSKDDGSLDKTKSDSTDDSKSTLSFDSDNQETSQKVAKIGDTIPKKGEEYDEHRENQEDDEEDDEEEEEEKAMDQAYDQVLDNLAKIRTNNKNLSADDDVDVIN